MTEKISIDNTMIFKKNPQIQEVKTKEGLVISPLDSQDKCFYYLDNEVSLKIWEMLDGKNSLAKIKEELSLIYEIDEETLDKDIKDFIRALYLKKIIHRC